MTPRNRAAGYLLVLAPAITGAVLDAPWILTLALVGVAAFFATRAGVLVAPRELRQGPLAKGLC